MPISFFDADELKMKVDGTVCRYRGRPVFVRQYNASRIFVMCYDLVRKGVSTKVDTRWGGFDSSSVPLGYMDYGDNTYYLKRIPHRRYKAGVRLENIAGAEDMDDYLRTRNFYRCILGIHLPISEAITRVNTQGYRGVAISRHLALRKHHGCVDLVMRDRAVAHKQRNRDVFDLIDRNDRSFMELELRKIGVKFE